MSRNKLMGAIAGSHDITFLRPPGNMGDHLIHAGTRRLLAGIHYTEFDISQAERVRGHTALIGGSGGWCGPFHDLPAYLPVIEANFERVIVLPSSFDTKVGSVRRALVNTKGLIFARENVSFNLIRDLCRAELALDCAFFFDFGPYRNVVGEGRLSAFRTDGEAAGGGFRRETTTSRSPVIVSTNGCGRLPGIRKFKLIGHMSRSPPPCSASEWNIDRRVITKFLPSPIFRCRAFQFSK